MNSGGEIRRKGGSDQASVLTHRAEQQVPANVRNAAGEVLKHTEGAGKVSEIQTHRAYNDGQVDMPNVVTHLANSLTRGQLPKVKTHKDAQQAPINDKNPFKRFLPDPPVDLELDKTFLGLPIVDVRELHTNALIEKKRPEKFYQFLAWCFGKPGGFSQEELTAISLTRMALLYEHKDMIINMCRNPKFSQNEVAEYIATKTGILLDVGPNPKDTIRLIEDGLRVGLKLLEEIPHDADKATTAAEVKKIIYDTNVFRIGDVKFHDQVKQLREQAFSNKYGGELEQDIVLAEVISEGRSVSVYKPKSNLKNRDFLNAALVAYKKNQPEDMSASAFHKQLSIWVKECGKEKAITEKEIFDFVHESIMDCVLGAYIPSFDDRKDSDEDVLVEALGVYLLNASSDDNAYGTANAFRSFILKEHPYIPDYKLEKFLQEMIRRELLTPYVPRHDDTTGIQRILNEELMAYKLNKPSNAPANYDDKAAVEVYFKRRLGVEQAAAHEEDLKQFLLQYALNQAKPYVPKYDKKTYIQKILNEELAAYKRNKPADAGSEYDSKAALQTYLKDERKILSVKGMKKGSNFPVTITEEDLKEFLKSYDDKGKAPLVQ